MVTRAPSKLRRSLAALLSSTLIAGASIVGLAAPSQADEAEVSGATLSWGLRESFRNYISGPIAQGEVSAIAPATVSGSGIVSWSGGTGTLDDEDYVGSTSFAGGVHYVGHDHGDGYLMDLEITNPRIEITSGSTAVLYVDLDRTGYGTAFPDPAQIDGVPLANITLPEPVVENGVATWTDAAATLHPDGVTVFIGFYAAGSTLDPITFSLPYEVATPDPVQTGLALSASPEGTADEDAEVAFTASVTPAEAAGSVEFFSGTSSLGTEAVSDGAAMLRTSDLAVGAHSITAVFTPADADAYTPADAGALSYTITAAEQPPVSPTLTVTPSTGLDPEGDTVTVSGTGYNPNQPIYVAICTDIPVEDLTFAFIAAGCTTGAKQVTLNPTTPTQVPFNEDGSFETTFDVAPKEGSTAIYTLANHTAQNDRSQDAKVTLTFAAGNDDDDDDGEEPVTPNPSVTVSPTADLDPSVENVLTISGTGFTGDGAANGVYVLFGETSVWSGEGPLVASGWIDLGWVPAAQLTEGAFTTTLTIPADSLDPDVEYHVATSAAHALSITNRTLDTFTPVTVAQGSGEPEPDLVIDITNPGDTVAQGGTLRFTAGGFAPGESVTATVYSDPIVIGTVAADADGVVTFAWAVPENFPAGEHTLELVGEISGTVEITFTVSESGTDDDDEEPAPTCTVVDSGSLTWGVRESFRTYVVGPIASGEISTSGNVTQAADNGPFTWSGATGTYDTDTEVGVVGFTGAVTFTGHGGVLDLTLSDPRVRILSATTGELVVDVVGTDYPAGDDISADDVVVATLTFTSSVNGDELTFSDAEAVLTDGGTAAFAGFYPAGTVLDPASLNVTLGEDIDCGAPPTPTVPRPTPPVDDDDTDDDTDDNGDDSTPAPQCVAHAVSGATLTWGVRETFRNYITGNIAAGSISTSGVSQGDSGAFTWSGGSGSFNTEDSRGRVSFGGSVTFTGHGGELDLTIANPRVQVTGARSANLIADVSSAGYNAPDVNASGIVLATLTLPAPTTSGGTITWSGASATLTSAGAEAFMGFYDAGAQLDPVSFSFPLGATVECDASSGTLPNTGVQTDAAALLALSMVMLGVGVVVLRTRRGSLAQS